MPSGVCFFGGLMDTKLPAFLFYANDFIGSTAHYEVETVGAYIRLLCFQWVNGAIPNSKKEIQGIISCSANKFEEIWGTLKPKFEEKNNGFLNKKLEKIRQEALEYRKNRSKAGKKGNEKRWHSDRTAIANTIANPIAKHRSSSSSSSSKEKGNGRFAPPSLDDVFGYCRERKNGIDADRFVDFYTSRGWMMGKTKMKDWKAAIRTWEKSNNKPKEPSRYPVLA